MAEYLNIGKEAQAILIRKLKDNCSLSWTQLAAELGVGRSMMFFYLRGKCRLPKEKLLRFASISNITITQGSLNFEEIDFSVKTPSLPEMSADLAEFLGILYGDGCLVKCNFGVDVSGDKRSDILFHKNKVGPLIKKLFNLEVKFQIQKNCIHTRLHSKVLNEFLSKVYFFPIGEKKTKMRIPPQIYQRDEYKLAFLRGLFDTDGGIDYHHFRCSQLHYTCYDAAFLKEVFDLFKSLNFNVKLAKRDVKMFERSEIARFFKEVSPANPKHTYKYQKFLETGMVPRHRDIDYLEVERWVNADAGNRTRVRTLEGSNVAIAPHPH